MQYNWTLVQLIDWCMPRMQTRDSIYIYCNRESTKPTQMVHYHIHGIVVKLFNCSLQVYSRRLSSCGISNCEMHTLICSSSSRDGLPWSQELPVMYQTTWWSQQSSPFRPGQNVLFTFTNLLSISQKKTYCIYLYIYVYIQANWFGCMLIIFINSLALERCWIISVFF